MNVVIMLLESNCLSLSLAQNWSALRRSYRCAMLVLLDAGQGPAMGKMRKEGSWCQQLGLVPSSPAPGLDTTLCPGSRKPCPQASGSSPTWAVSMHGLPSAQQSITLVAGRWVWGWCLPPWQFGDPQLNPSAVFKARRRLLAQLAWPWAGMQSELCFAAPQHHTSELSLHPMLSPAPQPYRAFKVGGSCVEIMCKYANYFIMSLAWNATHRVDKSLAATEIGKAKRISKRDAKLPHPPLAYSKL